MAVIGSLTVVVIVLLSSAWARPTNGTYSTSVAVGHGKGGPYQTTGVGHVTAIRIWECYSSYIAGIQFQYDGIWSAVVGRTSGPTREIELRGGEAVVQISGKWYSSNYIYQIQFVTNRGRSFTAGQPTGWSFNFYPVHPDAELLLLSGRFDGSGITSISAHWGAIASN